MSNAKKNFIWNMIGSLVFSFATIFLTTLVKRIAGIEAGGDFTVCYKLAQTFLTIGFFEVRLFQVTDEKEEYSFSDYFSFRLLTCAMMMAACVIYLIATKRTGDMFFLILFLCIYKMMDAFGDVFEGEYQKNDRLYLAGMSLTVRVLVSSAVFLVMLTATKNLVLASTALALSAVLVVIFYNTSLLRTYKEDRIRIKADKLKPLFLDCVLLALGAFLCSYILNNTTFAVDAYAREAADTDINYIFGALFMPTAVINLFSTMIFKPVLTTLTSYYDNGRIKAFLKMFGALILAVVLLTIVCVLGAWLLGTPVLSLLYAVDLTPFRNELLILILGGGINAAAVLSYYCLVIMRQQRNIFICYVLTFAVTYFIPGFLVRRFGLMGASLGFAAVMTIQFVIFTALLLIKCRAADKH